MSPLCRRYVAQVINMIGLGMGLLVWGCTNMLVGWASGRFGIIVDADTLSSPVLNSFGAPCPLIRRPSSSPLRLPPAHAFAARGLLRSTIILVPVKCQTFLYTI